MYDFCIDIETVKLFTTNSLLGIYLNDYKLHVLFLRINKFHLRIPNVYSYECI